MRNSQSLIQLEVVNNGAASGKQAPRGDDRCERFIRETPVRKVGGETGGAGKPVDLRCRSDPPGGRKVRLDGSVLDCLLGVLKSKSAVRGIQHLPRIGLPQYPVMLRRG